MTIINYRIINVHIYILGRLTTYHTHTRTLIMIWKTNYYLLYSDVHGATVHAGLTVTQSWPGLTRDTTQQAALASIIIITDCF